MPDAVITVLGTIFVGILAFAGTVIGARYSAKVAIQTTNNLVLYRIDELEKKVDKHNNLVDRMYKIEEKATLQEEKNKVMNHRIEDLEREKVDHE